MANLSTTRKIVSLNAAAGERSPGMRIVAESTERLCDSLCRWLAEIRGAVAEELLTLADGTRDRPLQTRYLDLRHDVERDWTPFIEAFRHAFADERRKAQPAPAERLELPDFEGLQLVDDDALSEHIVIREFAAQLAETCDEELYALDRRVAALLGQETPLAGGNPLAPQYLCQALVEAGAALGLDAGGRLLLLRRIERHLHRALPGCYREINAELGERGILRDLKRSYRRTDTGRRGEAAPAATAADGGSGALPPGTADTPTDEAAGIVGVLQRLAAARCAPVAPAFAAIGTPSPASVSHAFLASLDEAQHTEWHPAAGVALNQVHVIRDSAAAQQVSALESVTIDIVAMLFDFIFNDDELPDSVKSLIGQLQIPVLKVAMLDHSFFANRQHPARRFLDGIAGVALHWGANAVDNDPFHRRLGQTVARIQQEFESNVEIFSEAIAELEAFVTAHEAEEAETLGIAAEAAVRREAEEAAAERAQAALRPIIERPQPAVVRAFLVEHWSVVLRQKALHHGEDAPAWREAVEVAEQLVWSVAAKGAGDERMRLISALPMLLARINAGLSGTGIAAGARSDFFDALVGLHAAALKGANESPAPAADAAGTEAAADSGEGDLLVTRRVEEGIVIEDVMLVGAPPMRRARDREALEQVHDLKRGDWVDFVDADGHAARERLNWVSPQKGILVFSNHRAARAISISPEALARQIRDGRARLVVERSVIDRAIDGVMQSLNAA